MPGLYFGPEVIAHHKDHDEGQDQGRPLGVKENKLERGGNEEHHLEVDVSGVTGQQGMSEATSGVSLFKD